MRLKPYRYDDILRCWIQFEIIATIAARALTCLYSSWAVLIGQYRRRLFPKSVTLDVAMYLFLFLLSQFVKKT